MFKQASNDILLQRLQELPVQPSHIASINIEPPAIEKLQQQYPQAQITTLLQEDSLFPQEQRYDVIIYCNLLAAPNVVITVLQQLQPLLTPQGILLFSTLAPDTLVELIPMLTNIAGEFSHPPFIDMHNWGDLLQHLNFSDIVVNAEYISIYYTTVNAILTSLQQEQLITITPQLTTAQQQHLAASYEQHRHDEHGLLVTAEIVCALAYAAKTKTKYANEVAIAVQQVTRKKL